MTRNSYSPLIEPQALPEKIGAGGARLLMLQIGGDFALEDVERAHIEAVVSRCRTKEEAAQVLRIDDSTLYRKRKRFETAEH